MPYLVVLTSLPTSTTSSLALNSHVKRQFEDEGDYEIEYSEDENYRLSTGPSLERDEHLRRRP